MKKTVSKKTSPLKGEITVPADKSVSHRAIMFAALAKGKSVIKNFSNGKDPNSTLEIFKQSGIEIDKGNDGTLYVNSSGILKPSEPPLCCGNSGTTMRLASGIFAGQNFTTVLTGDESLSSRPMKRIIEPLMLMGAKITSNNGKAPLNIIGTELRPINYVSKLASAQIKSCVLLAGMHVKDGVTTFTEPYLSRNHTELMLKSAGADIKTEGTTVSIRKSELSPLNIEIFGDISSAAYFIAAALLVPGSDITIKNIGLNPTRTGIIDIVKAMNGNIEILDLREVCGEKVGDIRIGHSNLKGCEIKGEIIPRLIDEIPIIAVMAATANGETVIKDAGDLRNKESDRIKAVVTELSKLGADIRETPDGMIINGVKSLQGGVSTQTYSDHRLAMSLYVAGLICEKDILINGFEWVNISFPEFEEIFEHTLAK